MSTAPQKPPSLLRQVKRFVARLVRERPHPRLDAELREYPGDAAARAAYNRRIEGTFLANDEGFVRGRFEEALRQRLLVEQSCPAGLAPPKRVLDVGGGNGAFELAGASAGWSVFSVEQHWNAVVVDTLRDAGLPLRRVVADIRRLPFRDGGFEVVTCFDTLEHLEQPRACGSEVARTLAQEGLLFLTTPSRLAYLFRPDPHFNIRGLVALPPSWQRKVAARRGFGALYHVERIYGSASQIRDVFPGTTIVAIVSRWRFFRRYLWDLLILRKAESVTRA